MHIIAIPTVLLIMFLLKKSFSWRLHGINKRSRFCSTTSRHANEFVWVADSNQINPPLEALQQLRPQIKISQLPSSQTQLGMVWSMHRGRINLDSVELEDYYLGTKRLSDDEIAQRWNSMLNERVEHVNMPNYSIRNYGEGDFLTHELQAAVGIVQRSANIIRSLQRSLCSGAGAGISKGDNTPVTIADLAIQALIIDALSSEYPTDSFIAEEDSGFVRRNNTIKKDVIEILEAATGSIWTEDRLYTALDKGATCYDKAKKMVERRRVWVLDPIDGTKGFLRGEHCCTGLALLIDGKVALSAIGCPNLNLRKLLQTTAADAGVSKLYAVHPSVATYSRESDENCDDNCHNDYSYSLFHPESGSVYFAVTGLGAYARSLSMPLGAAYDVSTSCQDKAKAARLCESAEAAFGNRNVTARTADILELQNSFIRVDGK